MNKFIRIYFDIKNSEPDLFVKRSNKNFELVVQTAGIEVIQFHCV
jgi:hypothetical protein